MASESKRRKGKNSKLAGLGERNDIEKWKCKRIAYFTKRDRLINKRRTKDAVLHTGRMHVIGEAQTTRNKKSPAN